VVPSNLADKFTLDERYEASILNSEPIAPSIDHPICSPDPSFTL